MKTLVSASSIVFAALVLPVLSAPVAVTVDFGKDGGAIRRALHSSGLGGQLVDPPAARLDDLRPLNLYAARTHDWALTNPGQRVIDTHFVFPLLHADAEDARNYFFGPTDEILAMTTEQLGMKVLYRMGTSIESVNSRRKWSDPEAPLPKYYNSVEPSDWEQYAKALSHIIRHYTRGWADGRRWAKEIPCWELWNEPNTPPGGCWINADGDTDAARNRTRYNTFSVFVLKRLKAEFPELSFGGPATCFCDLDFVRAWLGACKAAGYAPDFVTWHHYSSHAGDLLATPAKMRALCDELGFAKTRLFITEWHYIPYPEVWGDFGGTGEKYARIVDPVDGLNGIASAVYTLQVIAGLQYTCLDESYYYGCGQVYGCNWGIYNLDGSFNKNYYALKMFGTVLSDCDRLAALEGRDAANPVQAYGYLSNDGKRRYLIVSRAKFGPETFEIDVKGLGERKLKRNRSRKGCRYKKAQGMARHRVAVKAAKRRKFAALLNRYLLAGRIAVAQDEGGVCG